jgi:undecaprenyl diphosphate synthase
MINKQGSSLPGHLAIIMDGNGRWAERRGKNRFFGHFKGTRVAKKIIEECSRLGIENLTLYTFSTENWSRPHQEVSFLMKLLAKYLIKERKSLIQNNIRFQCIGQIDRLPKFAQEEITKTIQATQDNTGLNLFFALSYGGRQEILAATQAFAQLVKEGRYEIEDLNENLFSTLLSTFPTPDPDLIIRTSGEMRLSNFLTWQSVYSEIYVTQTLWPDFSIQNLHEAINHYLQRERRFGKTSSQILESSL